MPLMLDICATCIHFTVANERNTTGTIAEASSTNIGCRAGVFRQKPSPGTYTADDEKSAAIRTTLLEKKYKWKPIECQRYVYGVNNYHDCQSCQHAQVVSRPEANATPTVVGCHAKNIGTHVDIDLLYASTGSTITVPRDERITAQDCPDFTPLTDEPNVFRWIEQMTPAEKKDKKQFKLKHDYNRAACSVRQEEFDALKQAYELTGCKIYRKMASLANRGRELTQGHKRVLWNLRKNTDRLARKSEFVSRLENLRRTGRLDAQMERYLYLVNEYGFLTNVQERRLITAENT